MEQEIGTPPIGEENQQPSEPSAIAPEEKASEATASDAWDDVVARLGDLGDSISQWTKAATHDPEMRRKVEEVKTRVSEIAGKAEAAVSETSSDVGEQVRVGMAKAGQAIEETVKRVSAAAAPHVSNALAELSNQFARAAARVDQAIKERTEKESEAGEVPPAPPVPEAPEAPEPPAPPAPPEQS